LVGHNGGVSTFRRLLINSLVAGVVNSFLWFALTFWVYLETRSVVTTSAIGGAFALCNAAFAVLFGTYVDTHPKRRAMLLSTVLSLGGYLLAGALYLFVDRDAMLDLRLPWIWLLILIVLAASMAGNIRAIALSTCVTLLVPSGERDKANGQVGMVNGLAFTVTSVFSGLVIGQLGMGWAIAITIVGTVAAMIDLWSLTVPGDVPAPSAETTPRFDFAGARLAVAAVPGLFGLILFAAFNNLLGGVFMSLMDAYGLELVSVETWGFLWGGLSVCFILGGLFVARKGVGRHPLRTILLVNAANWIACTLFTIRTSIVLLAIGCAVWLALMPIVEAAEQTVLQQVVPFDVQGRVFGLAQTIESAASPLTSLSIGPIAQWIVIPFMTTGAGAGTWFGSGRDRAIALIFTVAGLLGLVATAITWVAPWYRRLSARTGPVSLPA
jgi:MFS transporter, DHA3 family, multidrug efflux protein